MKPAISINLCCYNSEKYLRETLQSIVNQTYKDWELVIINDGSSDSTESIILEFINQGYPIIYHYQENRGLGASRNEALKLSQGEYIALIDHDDIWLPQKLEKQIPLFIDPQVGLVYCGALHFLDGTKFAYSTYDLGPPACKGNIFGTLLANYGLTLSTIVIRRSVLVGIPWFPEEMVIAEELDLILRIAYSWKIDYVLEPFVKYRVYEGNTTVKATESEYQEREEILKRLVRFFPFIMNEYKRELAHFREKNTLIQTHFLWQKNERVEARKTYLKLFRANRKWKLLVFFIFSYFYSFEQFHKLKVKIKYWIPKFLYNTYRRLNF